MAVDPSARSWKAGLPWSTADSFAGRFSKLGGTLVLTDTEVVFKPLRHLGRTRRYRLEDIAAVTPFAERPPRLRIVPRSARPAVFFVLPSRTTSSGSTDTSARDEAVRAIAAST